MATEAEIKDSLRDCIARLNGKVPALGILNDTPIIERRIITSLQVMDLILELEQLRGRPVDVESLKPGVFRDIDAMYAAFLKEGAPGTEGAAGE